MGMILVAVVWRLLQEPDLTLSLRSSLLPPATARLEVKQMSPTLWNCGPFLTRLLVRTCTQ